MFDRIAGPYDAMNRAMTAGLDRRWRKLAADEAGLDPGDRALDVCCGTGELTLALARRSAPAARSTGSTSRARCSRGRAPSRGRPGAGRSPGARATRWRCRTPDDTFQAATVAFGVRNLPDLDAGLRELRRVVRPGGRVVCLEITQPSRQPLAGFYALWFDRLVPALGRRFDAAGAYAYLPASVRRFPRPRELGERLWRAGLVDVRYRLLAGGIVALHVGEVHE